MSVAWFEIQVPDLKRAKRFYSTVFGWTFGDMGEHYVTCTTPDGEMIGGLEQSTSGDPDGRQIQVYLGTDELEAVLGRVKKAGGKVVNPRSLISEEYGWSAAFTDPGGAKLGLWTRKPA
jgi:predicted enzyme related to lactoylglutathione lyase